MSVLKRRVVITGMGLVTPLGLEPAGVTARLLAGTSAVRRIGAFDPAPLTTQIAAEVEEFEPKKLLDKAAKKQLRVMARSIQFAVVAAQAAVNNANIEKGTIDPTRFGVEFGAGLLPSELYELGRAAQVAVPVGQHAVDFHAWGENGLPNITPLWMLKYLPNMLACHVSVLHDAQGPSNSITESEVGGLLALGEALHIIQRDQADVFLVGSADSKINPLSLARYQLFANQCTTSNDAPHLAVKPFDRYRAGCVMGEAGAVLVVEELQHATARGVPILGEVVGFGAAFDRGLTGQGIARALRAALHDAKIEPADVGFVAAHGMGSPRLDAAEAVGIYEVFGSTTPVWGIKGQIGTVGAGCGTVETAAALLVQRAGTLPATCNHRDADPALPPLAVTREPRPITKPCFVKLAFTDMGQVAAAVIVT